MSYTGLAEKLEPRFTSDDMKSLQAYHVFYSKYWQLVNEQLRGELLHHPIFGSLIKSQDLDTQLKEDKISRDLQEAAIMRNEWEPYILRLMSQGTIYSQKGIEFSDWYSVVNLFRDLMLPHLMTDLSNDIPRLSQVLRGTNKLMDYAMSIIAASYIEGKNKTIFEEQTKTHEALEQLQIVQDRFSLAVEGSSSGLWDWDIVTNEVFFAPRFKALLGYEDQEFVNMFSSFENALHPKDKEHTFERINKTLKSNAPYDVTYRLKTKKRGYRWFLARGKVLRDEHGNAYRMAGSIADITDAKKSEQAVKKLNATLEQKVHERTAELRSINEELESFSYTVSHDLRTPLRAIDGFSKVLFSKLSGQLQPEQLHYLDVIIQNVGKMGRLIDDLLAFSQVSRREKRETTFDIVRLIEEEFSEFMHIEGNDKVELKIAPNLPMLFADRNMMKHVVSNLLGNAIKFSIGKEQPFIEVGYEFDNHSNIYFVKDNGVGFDMAYSKKLFGIFQRLHSDDEFEGTGVGLAIVQRIVHRHQGHVWAEAEEGKGATFYFSIPKPDNNNAKV